MGLVLQCPLSAGPYSRPDGNEIGGEGYGDGKKRNDTAEFGATGEFIEEDQAEKNHQQHPPLGKRMLAIDMEKHRGLVYS